VLVVTTGTITEACRILCQITNKNQSNFAKSEIAQASLPTPRLYSSGGSVFANKNFVNKSTKKYKPDIKKNEKVSI